MISPSFMRYAAANCFVVSGIARWRFNHLRIRVVAVVLGVAGCRHAPSFPTRWGNARAAADVAFVVGETRSSSHDRPVQAARVRLVGATGIVRDSVRTDAAGAFVLGPVPPGDYHLEVHALLHWGLSRSLALRAGAVDTVRLRLKYSDAGVISDCWPEYGPDGRAVYRPCRP